MLATRYPAPQPLALTPEPLAFIGIDYRAGQLAQHPARCQCYQCCEQTRRLLALTSLGRGWRVGRGD